MENQNTEEPVEIDPRIQVRNDEWSLILQPNQGNSGQSSSAQLFLIWTAEFDMPHVTLLACQQLNSIQTDIPHLKLEFDSDPIPGFALRFTPGWQPNDDERLNNLFKQLVWEIRRIQP